MSAVIIQVRFFLSAIDTLGFQFDYAPDYLYLIGRSSGIAKMKCPKCQSENPETQKFCGECGTRISPTREGEPEFPQTPVSPPASLPTETLQAFREELTTGSIFAGRYRIVEELGGGGMGKVYRALDTKLDEEVALKLIKLEIASDETTLERFRNELKIARNIVHKNVGRMYHLSEEKGIHYITMEYISGEDLKSFIRRSGQLAVETVLRIARQVGEGLAEAHRLGVVHRDLKPGNIMIDREGNARIMDFGIARSIKGRGITGGDVIIGTPEYMSPEQVDGKELDQRSDIYSLGIIIYEMATGRVPFEGITPFSIAVKHKLDFPPPPKSLNSRIPEGLNLLILTCLEKDREKRFKNAEAFLQELGRIGEAEPETAQVPAWKKSIAVLPFKSMSADPEQEYFCEGLAEELINTLTKIQDLRVVARTSAFSFKGRDIDIREIGKKLNVETVLEGSVRKSGSRLRIMAQLINVADGYHLWSERFDREMEDVFAIQDEISLAIAGRLKLQLLGEEKENVIRRYTENIEAYNLYLKGIYWRRMLQPDRVHNSIEYFKQAIEKDPGFALAYAGLAYAYQILSFYAAAPSKEYYPKAKQAALKALELDDRLAEAHESLGVITGYQEWDWKNAEREYLRALELSPGYVWAHFHLANTFLYQGRYDEAVRRMQKSHALDPLNIAFNRNLGLVYFRSGRLEDAVKTFHRTIELDPSFVSTHLFLGYVYIQMAKYEEALEVIQKDTLPRAVVDLNLGVVYAQMGRRDEALRIFNDYQERSKREFFPPYYFALLCFAIGEKDLGFKWLEKGYEEHDGWMVSVKVDFLLEGVRQDPKFGAILKKMNLVA